MQITETFKMRYQAKFYNSKITETFGRAVLTLIVWENNEK